MPTLEQIQAKLKKLQAQADVLIARKAQAAVDQIRDLMQARSDYCRYRGKGKGEARRARPEWTCCKWQGKRRCRQVDSEVPRP